MSDGLIRLVMVEDLDSDAELIRRQLTRSGLECEIHRVQTASSYVAALQSIQPHAILSDFSMPQFDGLRALEIARAQVPDTPFIFVSGTLGEERAVDALHRGATDYVLKNNLTRLGPAVRRALRESELRGAQRQAEQQLRENEQRLRDTVETSQDWIWELDAEGRFCFCSAAVTRMLGFRPAELLGQDFRGWLHDEERTRAVLLPTIEQPQLTGAVARWRAVDGQLHWLERNAVLMLDAAGRVSGYRGSERDITTRREQDQRLSRLSRTYRMLSSTSSAILRQHDRFDLLNEIARIVLQQGGYQRVVISLIDPHAGTLQPRARAGADGPALRSFDRSAFDRSVIAGVDRHPIYGGATMLLNDVNDEEPDLCDVQVLREAGYHAFAALPVQIDGTTVAVMTLFSAQAAVFDRAEVEVLLELTANLGFALQYLEKEETVHFLSYFDSLTGLAKRVLFCQRLEHRLTSSAAEEGSHLVIVFDVQQLGAINDSYGRYVGDRLLERIAARLKEVHGGHLGAHLGGGTFALLLEQPRADDAGGQTGQLLHNAAARLFAQPFSVEGLELRPAVRAGIALHPHDAASAEALVQSAEAALKAAREDSERFMLFGMVRERPSSRTLALEARLAGALERGEFLLHYQPKIHIASGRIEGLEALLRWQDVQEGLVPPSLFVPLLERSGAIGEVGEWVLQQALRDLRGGAGQEGLGQGDPTLRVAINVSPRQLRRRDFVERVLECVGGEPGRCLLDIEITESMLMQDIEQSMRKLAQLREAGIGVAIDDFGTGYSSLRLLSRLPVDTLKIDRSFTQNLESASTGLTLVSTIVSLARALGMTTVAEGVETAAQLQLLRQMQCDQAQGFLFARPAPFADIPALLARLALPGDRA